MAVYTRDEVAKHNNAQDCWVIYKGAVVNLATILDNHPGGRSLLLPFLGADISDAFDEVGHSTGALDIIQEYQIGSTPDNQHAFTLKAVPKVDPTKSVVAQVFSMDLESYKLWVNQPSLAGTDARLFDADLLELITKVPLQILHIVWLLAAFYYYWAANLTFQGTISTTIFVFALWSLVEYGLHRYPFHMELYIPDNPYLIVLHFLLHGVHHVYPFDKLRLPIFQPLSVALFLVLRFVTWLFLPDPVDEGVFGALLLCYVYYETVHYANHFESHEHYYLTFMKSYHLKHHFSQSNYGYGITNKVWDVVFKTELPLQRSILSEVRANIGLF
jgi:4-hydroxysphinganine ceramide fatty acyl 2-hydroxylase